MRQTKQPAVGIDLGTTYSVVACLDETGRPQTLNNAEGDILTPSVVLIEDYEVIVGKEAVKAMGDEMERIADCSKRDVGQRMYHKSLGGRQYPPEALRGLDPEQAATGYAEADRHLPEGGRHGTCLLR